MNMETRLFSGVDGARMDEWQPIATAPQQYFEPLLLYPKPREAVPQSRNKVFEGYWSGDGWRCSSHLAAKPTHWRPLPDPPLCDAGGT